MNRDRYYFLDRLRVGAACAVVMLHTVTGAMDITDMSVYPAEKMVFIVLMDLITWCVPIFLMISGFLFLDPRREITFGKMLRRYCSRIVFALFLFGVPYAGLELVMNSGGFSVGMLGESVRMVLQGKTWSHMWYLYLLLVLYLITPLLKKIISKIPMWAVYGFLWILLMGSSILPFVNTLNPQLDLITLPSDTIYLFYYLVGYVLHNSPIKSGIRGEGCFGDASGESQDEETVSAGIHWHVAVPGILTLAVAAAMAASRLIGYQTQMAYHYPPTVLLSLLLMWTAKEGEAIWPKGGKLMGQLGSLSFAVYLIHPVFLNIFYKFLHLSPLSYPVFLSIPAFFTATLLLSAAGAWILRKLPFMKQYVL